MRRSLGLMLCLAIVAGCDSKTPAPLGGAHTGGRGAGRPPDRAVTPLELLPSVVDAVGDTAEVYVDGGDRVRGSGGVHCPALPRCAHDRRRARRRSTDGGASYPLSQVGSHASAQRF